MSTRTDPEFPADSTPVTAAVVTVSSDARTERAEQGSPGSSALLPALLSLLAAGALAAGALALAPRLCSSLFKDVPGAGADWSLSWRMRGTPVAQLVQTRWQPTTLLVGASLGLAYLLALLAAGVALLVHRLEQAVAPLAALLKAVGRLALYPQATLPVYVLSVVLAIFLLPLLPDSAGRIVATDGELSALLPRLALPALALALLPGLLAGQTIAQEITRPRQAPGGRAGSALLGGLAALLEQTAGVLGASVIVEQFFGWPGLGRNFVVALAGRDYPVCLGIVWAYAGIVLAARLLATFARWPAARGTQPQPALPTRPAVHRPGRTIWGVFAVTLLVVPLALALAGLAVGPDAPAKITAGAQYAAPSAQFPWGTDALGRDLRARALRGGFNTLSSATLVGLALVPLAVGGWTLWRGLARRLPHRARWIARMLRLPLAALLFIPVLVLVAFLRLLWLAGGEIPWTGLLLILCVALLPRACCAWEALRTGQRCTVRAVAGAAAALGLSGIFSAFWALTLLEVLGLAAWPPPAPTLGGLFTDALAAMSVRPELLFVVGGLAAGCSFCLFTAADAVSGFFTSKQVMAHFNR